MPTIIRKSPSTLVETRRETHRAVSWQVHSNVWRPLTDVYETDDNVIVRMEIAGLRDENLEVTVQANVLKVSGLRSDISERRAYHQMEIPFGRFEISIDLPLPVDMENAVAEYKNGFLIVILPKSTPRQNEVK